MQWWVLIFLSAVVLLGSASAFLWTRASAHPVAVAPAAPPRVRCPNLDGPIPSLLPEADSTPLLLWGAGKVRLFIDGKPAFSAPDAPRSFAPVGHVLRAEVEGKQPIEMRFRLDAFRPAFFHVEQSANAGLNIVFLGATCLSCAAAMDKVGLEFTRTSESDEVHLDEAARALRIGDWRAAASRLRGVSPKSRGGAAFLRLAANVYQSTAQTQAAQASLMKVPAKDGNDLQAVLKAWEELTASEAVRSKTLPMRRWNLLTEKFSGLFEKFAPEAPGPVQLATSRMSELSEGFLAATNKKDTIGQDDTVTAGMAALEQFVRELRRSKPFDCEFQSRITASL